MDTEKVISWLAQEFVLHWAWYCGWLLLSGVGAVLGTLIFGRGYKRRIAALERKLEDQQQSQTFNVAGDLITVNHKPVARFTQKFEMLDKVIPLANGQIMTFFAPVVSVEYLSGDKETIELPKAKFEEVVRGMEAQFRANPELFKNWEPVHLKPDKLREMLKEYEDDDP